MDKAIGDWSEVIRLSPTNSEAYRNRGIARALKGDTEAALRDYSQAIRLSPGDARAYNNRGALYRRHGRVDEAFADLNQALNLSPDFASAIYNRGLCYYKEGKMARAVDDFTKAIRLSPPGEAAKAFQWRGLAYYHQREWVKAKEDLRMAIRLAPDGPDGYNDLAWVLATCPGTSMRDGKEAVKLGRRACDLGGGKRWYCVGTLSAAFAETGDFAKAIEYEERAITMPGVTAAGQAKALKCLELFREGRPYHETPSP